MLKLAPAVLRLAKVRYRYRRARTRKRRDTVSLLVQYTECGTSSPWRSTRGKEPATQSINVLSKTATSTQSRKAKTAEFQGPGTNPTRNKQPQIQPINKELDIHGNNKRRQQSTQKQSQINQDIRGCSFYGRHEGLPMAKMGSDLILTFRFIYLFLDTWPRVHYTYWSLLRSEEWGTGGDN